MTLAELIAALQGKPSGAAQPVRTTPEGGLDLRAILAGAQVDQQRSPYERTMRPGETRSAGDVQDMLAEVILAAGSGALPGVGPRAAARRPPASRVIQPRPIGSAYARTATEGGRTFKSGEPVELVVAHNTTRAPRPGPNDSFQQKIEPSGYYVTHVGSGGAENAKGLGLDVRTLKFNRPLVIAENSVPEGRIYNETSWKAELSRTYGGKTGKALTQALIKDGYDAVVTVGKHGLGEIVSLSSQSNNE